MSKICAGSDAHVDQKLRAVLHSYDGKGQLLENADRTRRLKLWRVHQGSPDTLLISLFDIVHSAGFDTIDAQINGIIANPSFTRFSAEIGVQEEIFFVVFDTGDGRTWRSYGTSEFPGRGPGQSTTSGLGWLDEARWFETTWRDTTINESPHFIGTTIFDYWDGATDTMVTIDRGRRIQGFLDDSISYSVMNGDVYQYNRYTGRPFRRYLPDDVDTMNIYRKIEDSAAYQNYSYSYVGYSKTQNALHVISSRGHHIIKRQDLPCGSMPRSKSWLKDSTLYYTVAYREPSGKGSIGCAYAIKLRRCLNEPCMVAEKDIRAYDFGGQAGTISSVAKTFRRLSIKSDPQIRFYKIE